ncbi:MAG: hypothetical protein AABX01_03250 [Candidatus Micrarchaeota archaeon]
MSYSILLEGEARESLRRLDKATKIRIFKKLEQLKREDIKSRHMKHGLPYFVEEAGQFRIVFSVDEAAKLKKAYFIGSHKEYEDWYSTK